MKTAIVTPYYKESPETLARCIQSVKSQTMAADHLLVADGHPQPWIAEAGLRQIILDRSHADFGDTPRAIGFLLALREQYDAIQFLDADNVLKPHHVELMWAVQRQQGLDVVVATRYYLRPDGSVLPFVAADDMDGSHVDTGCYFFTQPAFAAGLRWGLIPKQLSCIGDRVFLSMLKEAGLRAERAVDATVGYTTLWRNMYDAVGEPAPEGAKTLDAPLQEMLRWWQSLTAEQQAQIQKTLGLKIAM